MSEVEKSMNVKDVLDAINKVNNKNVYPIYIPSLKDDVMFREMNTKQEKMLIKTIVDSPVYNTAFIFAFRQIMKENCAEDIKIDKLTLIDKMAIALTMRQKSIGDTFEFKFKNTDKTKTIVISEYIDSIREVVIPEDKVVGEGDLKVTCTYPTIATEYAVEKEFRSNSEDLEIDTVDKAREMIGTVFTNEIVKYIKTVQIDNDGEVTDMDLTEFKFKDRIKILEKIGNGVLSEIMGYIEESNKQLRESMKIVLELDEKGADELGTEKLTSVLEASSDFFIIY